MPKAFNLSSNAQMIILIILKPKTYNSSPNAQMIAILITTKPNSPIRLHLPQYSKTLPKQCLIENVRVMSGNIYYKMKKKSWKVQTWLNIVPNWCSEPCFVLDIKSLVGRLFHSNIVRGQKQCVGSAFHDPVFSWQGLPGGFGDLTLNIVRSCIAIEFLVYFEHGSEAYMLSALFETSNAQMITIFMPNEYLSF